MDCNEPKVSRQQLTQQADSQYNTKVLRAQINTKFKQKSHRAIKQTKKKKHWNTVQTPKFQTKIPN